MSSRRDFLSAALLGLTRKSERRIEGGFVNESYSLGHRLRDRSLPAHKGTAERIPIVIAGGGMAGLSAAWRLQKRGFHNYVLLEMEPEAGGNSRSGENEITPFPWGAHYVPVPGKRLPLVRELMQDLGVLTDGTWDERWLCHSPQERVFRHGRWQEGFEPDTLADREDWKRFEQRMDEFATSGEFVIPVPDRSRLGALDQLSMRVWLDRERFRSEYLRWYVDYACRDDFGTAADRTSAWMGIHYFASREHDERGPLTWPEGNGWIARRLIERVHGHIRCGQPVLHVGRTANRLAITTPSSSFVADAVIFAAPSFLAAHIVDGARPVQTAYSPWITANLTLHRLPAERGFSPAWDNVIANSPSLGYVVATHMDLRTHRENTVWTWYHALAGSDVRAARASLLGSTAETWKEFILHDLSRAHPDIRDCVSRIDLMRFGHALPAPLPGSLFHADRLTPPASISGLYFANSDRSGYSIFEEAQSRGVGAADKALARIGGHGENKL